MIYNISNNKNILSNQKFIGFLAITALVLAIIGIFGAIEGFISSSWYGLEIAAAILLLAAFFAHYRNRCLYKSNKPVPLPSVATGHSSTTSLLSSASISSVPSSPFVPPSEISEIPLPLAQLEHSLNLTSPKVAAYVLSISDKFFDDVDYFSAGWKTVYNKATFYLDIKPIEEISSHEETNLRTIAQSVNALAKPTFHHLEQYQNFHQKLKIINGLMTTENIHLESFDEQLSPDSRTLKDRIWAVHATHVLPSSGKLTPFIRDFRAGACKAPVDGFCPTIHFTLGELVRPHSKHTTWEHHPFALITPLGTIYDQVINFLAHDTFILGEWNISPMAVLIVPEGTVVTKGPYQVTTYNPEKHSLRKAVDLEIKQRNGLKIRMMNLHVNAGSNAYIEGNININTQSFFQKLINESSRSIAFGDHCQSIIGQSAAFGYLRWYKPFRFEQLNPVAKRLLYPVLYYYYEKVKDHLSPQQLLEGNHYLNKIYEIQSRMPSLPKTFYHASDKFHFLTREQLLSLQKCCSHIFGRGYNRYEFEALWAIGRWILIGDQRADSEGLPQIVDMMLKSLFIKPNGFIAVNILKNIIDLNLEAHSTTHRTLLRILQMDQVQRYLDLLTQYGSPIFHKGKDGRYHLETLDEVLRAHVDTARYFGGETVEQTITRLSAWDSPSMNILLQIRPIPIERDDHVTRCSFAHIMETLDFRDQTERSISDLYKPINAPDNQLFRYFQNDAYRSARGLWKRLRLETQFNTMFPNEDTFWNSSQSFWQIHYKMMENR